MVKLLSIANPDDENLRVPVIVDAGPGAVDVQKLSLFRAESEGNARALGAAVTFDAAETIFRRNVTYEFEIRVYVITEGFVATMLDELDDAKPTHFHTPWDLATSSSGAGAIQAVLVKTSLHERD